MGHESILYGAIVGSEWKITHPYRLHQFNEQVIKNLPTHDSWPFLTRPMFTLPAGGVVNGVYRSQLIHFGGTFKAIEWEWAEWLTKFEALLSQLYWDVVYLHLYTEGTVGNYHYHYQALDKLPCFFETEPPMPSQKWRFSGGPRQFNTAEEVEIPCWLYQNGQWQPE